MGNQEWNDDMTFSLSMNKYIDEIYRAIYPIESITRFTREDTPHILDKHFHIDTLLQLTNGMQITAQEKVRRLKYLDYQDFTLEYQSNKYGKPGEFTKLCTDIYFYGYGDVGSGLVNAYIFKPIDVKHAITTGELTGQLKTNQYHSTATFYAYPFSEFKKEWFVYKKPLNVAPDYEVVTRNVAAS